MEKNNMRILFDYQIFSIQRFGGISRYFCEIISRLSIPKDVLVKYSINYYLKTYKICPHLFPLPRFIYKRFKKYANNINQYFSCQQLSQGQYVFHPTYYNPYFLKYLGGNPYVITVHDMIHEKFPTAFIDANEVIANKKKVILHANRIIAISENTKNDIISILNVDPDKIDVIYHSTSMSFKAEIKFKITYPFLLFVGDRTYYKNFDMLLKAFSQIKQFDKQTHLICTGSKFNKEELKTIKELNLDNVIHQIKATDTTLRDLYQQALAFVFPSLYEGFGIPILEAFACKCPVILSNSSCFPEIAQKAGVYFDPYNVSSIKEAILSVIYNQNKRQELITLGERRLNDFSWEKTVSKTLEVYAKVWHK